MIATDALANKNALFTTLLMSRRLGNDGSINDPPSLQKLRKSALELLLELGRQ